MLRRARSAMRVMFLGSDARRGSIQGVNSLLLLFFAGLLLYLVARTQVAEPITWLMDRLRSAVSP